MIGLAILAVGLFLIAVKEIQIATEIETHEWWESPWETSKEVPIMLRTELIGSLIFLIGLVVAAGGAMSRRKQP